MKKFVSFALAAMCSGLSVSAETPAALGPVSILTPVAYASEAPVPERIRQECRLERQVVDDLHETLAAKGMGGAMLASADDGLVLKVTIERVIGQPGGGWSGPKTLTLGITLMRGGSVERTTSQSYEVNALNPFMGNCAHFERASSKLSELIAKWLLSDERPRKAAVSASSAAPVVSTSTE